MKAIIFYCDENKKNIYCTFYLSDRERTYNIEYFV